MTWADTVIGGVVVIESRKDPDRGAEDLRYFEWICWSIGGAIPVLLANGISTAVLGFSLTNQFFVVSLNALLMMSVAWFLPEKETQRRQNMSSLDVSYISRA